MTSKSKVLIDVRNLENLDCKAKSATLFTKKYSKEEKEHNFFNEDFTVSSLQGLNTNPNTPKINNLQSLFKKPPKNSKFFLGTQSDDENFSNNSIEGLQVVSKKVNEKCVKSELIKCRKQTMEIFINKESFEDGELEFVHTINIPAFHYREDQFYSNKGFQEDTSSNQELFYDEVVSEKEMLSDEQMSIENLTEMTNFYDYIKDFYEYTSDNLKKIKRIIKIGDQMLDKHKIKNLNFLDEINSKGINKLLYNYLLGKKLAIFDLDETLVHCETKDFEHMDKILEVPLLNGHKAKVGINIRPFLFEALNQIKNNYVLIIYTASHKLYADTILNYIDPDYSLFKYRLYRNNCIKTKFEGSTDTIYIKDLRILENIDINKIVIIDNSVLSFAFQLDNGIPILPFIYNKNDNELKILVNYLEYLFKCESIPKENRKILKLHQIVNENNTFISDHSESSHIEHTEEEKESSTNINLWNTLSINQNKSVYQYYNSNSSYDSNGTLACFLALKESKTNLGLKSKFSNCLLTQTDMSINITNTFNSSELNSSQFDSESERKI